MKHWVCILIAGWCGVTATGFAQDRRPAKAAKAAATSAANPKKNDKNSNDFFGDNQQEAKGPTEITAKDEAQFDSQSRSAVFIGNVKVIDPSFTMTSDKLTVHLNREQDGGGLQTAEAEGHVMIVHVNQPKPVPAAGGTPATQTAGQPATTPGQSPAAPAQPAQPVRSTGQSERAIYEAKDGSVTLLGWPQVTQGLNTHIAIEPGVKMVLYRDGRMKTYGSTRTLIQEKTEPNKSQTNAAQ
jgi:lipopolysaccharide export system protein LptA